MAENTDSEVERMVVTRIFDAPRELVWRAWTDPKYVMQWWGPKRASLLRPFARWMFAWAEESLCCMKNAGWVRGLECNWLP